MACKDSTSANNECEDHLAEPLVIFCRKCKLFICPECMEEKHKLHETGSAKVQLEKIKSKAPELLEQLKEKAEKQKTVLEEAEKGLEKQKKELQSGIDTRSRNLDEAILKLQFQGQTLINGVNSRFERQVAILKDVVYENIRKFEAELGRKIEKSETYISQQKQKQGSVKAFLDRAAEQVDLVPMLPKLQNNVTDPIIQQDKVETTVTLLPTIDDKKDLKVKLVPEAWIDIKRSRKWQWLQDLDITSVGADASSCIKRVYFDKLVAFKAGNKDHVITTLETIKPGETCFASYLVPIPIKAAEDLRKNLGGGLILRMEQIKRHEHVHILCDTANSLSHVKADIVAVKDNEITTCHPQYLPADVMLGKIIESILGWIPSCIKDITALGYGEGPDVSKLTVKEWFETTACGRISVMQQISDKIGPLSWTSQNL